MFNGLTGVGCKYWSLLTLCRKWKWIISLRASLTCLHLGGRFEFKIVCHCRSPGRCNTISNVYHLWIQHQCERSARVCMNQRTCSSTSNETKHKAGDTIKAVIFLMWREYNSQRFFCKGSRYHGNMANIYSKNHRLCSPKEKKNFHPLPLLPLLHYPPFSPFFFLPPPILWKSVSHFRYPLLSRQGASRVSQ